MWALCKFVFCLLILTIKNDDLNLNKKIVPTFLTACIRINLCSQLVHVFSKCISDKAARCPTYNFQTCKWWSVYVFGYTYKLQPYYNAISSYFKFSHNDAIFHVSHKYLHEYVCLNVQFIYFHPLHMDWRYQNSTAQQTRTTITAVRAT